MSAGAWSISLMLSTMRRRYSCRFPRRGAAPKTPFFPKCRPEGRQTFAKKRLYKHKCRYDDKNRGFTFLRIADKRRCGTGKIQATCFMFAISQTHDDFNHTRIGNVFFILKNHAAGSDIAVGALNHLDQREIDFGVHIKTIPLKINNNIIL